MYYIVIYDIFFDLSSFLYCNIAGLHYSKYIIYNYKNIILVQL